MWPRTLSQITPDRHRPTQNRDDNATYNLYTMDEMATVGEGFDWMLFFEAAGVADRMDDLIIRQPSYAESMGATGRRLRKTLGFCSATEDVARRFRAHDRRQPRHRLVHPTAACGTKH